MAELNYNIKAELNTTPLSANPTWSDLGIMMKNISQAINEVLYQATYLSDEGYGSTEVTGGQYTVTFTGDKKVGNPVNDFIFNPDIQYKFGEARKTQLRLTNGATTITWNVTLANITDAGGDANQPNAVSLAIHGNGKPIISSTVLRTLNVTSAAGATGKTIVDVVQSLSSDCGFMYKTGVAAQVVTFNQDLTTWTPLISGESITATAGQIVTVAEVNSLKKATGVGSATIVTG